MSTNVAHPKGASQSGARTRFIGLSIAAMVLAAGIGLGIAADRSGPAQANDSVVTQFQPSIKARSLQMMAEHRAERMQAISEHRAELGLRNVIPLDGSIRRS